MSDLISIGNGVAVTKDELSSLDAAAAAYYDHHDNVARSMISDPVQLEFFERWLKGGVSSPDPKAENFERDFRQVYDAIIELCMNGCC